MLFQHSLASNLRRKSRACAQSLIKSVSSDPSEKPNGASLDSATYAYLLRKCGEAKALAEGRRLHAHIVKCGYDQDTLLANLIVQMYGICGCVEDARQVFDGIGQKNVYTWTIMLVAYTQNGHLQEARGLFDGMPEKSSVSWNAMISAYAQYHHAEEALELFKTMNLDGTHPDKSTFINVLGACANLTALRDGKLVHANIVESGFQADVMVSTALLNMYGKCGNLTDARSLFNVMTERNVVTWTAMITAYAQNGHLLDARKLFDRMAVRNVVSWNAMITAYAQSGQLQEARNVFDEMVIRDLTTWNVIVAAYAQAGHLQDASSLFDKMPLRCVVSWTTMISAYAQYGQLKEAKRLFSKMPQHDVVAWNAMITAFGQNGHIQDAKEMFDRMLLRNVASWNAMVVAYAQNGHLEEARSMFNSILQPNVVSWGAMITAYAQHGHLEEAKVLFDSMPQRDVVSWNAMIAANAHDGEGQVALELFRAMGEQGGLQPNELTYVGVLDACGKLGSLADGKAIHAKILEQGFESTLVATSLIEMYGKCGSLDDARIVFEKMPQQDVISWNAIVSAYGQNGHGKEAIQLFRRMQQGGIQPEGMAFIHVIAACSHAGMLDEGRNAMVSMVGDYSIEPILEHYLCMIDLLGRAGQLQRAEELIKTMPFEADAVGWTSLLGACNVHADGKRGSAAASNVLELNSSNPAPYALLSSLYSNAGELVELSNLKKAMREKHVKKIPGFSFVELDKVQPKLKRKEKV